MPQWADTSCRTPHTLQPAVSGTAQQWAHTSSGTPRALQPETLRTGSAYWWAGTSSRIPLGIVPAHQQANTSIETPWTTKTAAPDIVDPLISGSTLTLGQHWIQQKGMSGAGSIYF